MQRVYAECAEPWREPATDLAARAQDFEARTTSLASLSKRESGERGERATQQSLASIVAARKASTLEAADSHDETERVTVTGKRHRCLTEGGPLEQASGMARDGDDRDSTGRGHANRDSRDSRRRDSSPRSRDSLSPHLSRSARAHDEPRRRYSESRPESPPRDAHRDRYSDRDRRESTLLSSPVLSLSSASALELTRGLYLPDCFARPAPLHVQMGRSRSVPPLSLRR